MDLLGIGPLELVMILVIILLVLGPNEMVKAGRTIGNLIRKLTTSDGYHALRRASREMRTLPNKLAREAGLDELEKEFPKIGTEPNLPKDIYEKRIDPTIDAWTKPPVSEIEPPTSPPEQKTEDQESIDPEANS
ncbi:twin-arginine translocase TatA/TatE family subunit [Chloroflexota bacterium]